MVWEKRDRKGNMKELTEKDTVIDTLPLDYPNIEDMAEQFKQEELLTSGFLLPEDV